MSDWVPTTCMRCAVGCGHLQRGADIGNGIDESQDPDGEWLNRPLVRRNGELVSTTWDVALSEALQAFRRADDEGEVAVLGSGQQTNEAAYALGKLARGGVGTPYYDANTTLCMASAVTAYYQTFGSDAPPCTYDDIVVVDPVETGTAKDADAHVAPEPGQDLALARAVLARLVDTDRIDGAFVAEATEGFDDLRESLPDSATAAAEAGVGEDAVELLADAFDGKALCYWGMGVNQHVQGTELSRALIDLTLATGNLRPGGGPFSLTGQANSMGTRVCSCKGTWPGHRPFEDRTSSSVRFGWSRRHIRTVVDVSPVERTTACGRSGKDRQRSVSVRQCDRADASGGRRLTCRPLLDSTVRGRFVTTIAFRAVSNRHRRGSLS